METRAAMVYAETAMRISKGLITAAGPRQRSLPLQTLIDRDGDEKSLLAILIEEILSSGVDEICVVVAPGDEPAYARVAGTHAGRLRFIEQPEPLGYAHAIRCAAPFVRQDPFMHLVADHLYVNRGDRTCAKSLVATAEAEGCSISAVQPTRESLLPRFGTVGGRRMHGRQDLYRIDTVIEKPTPTEAEQRLIVPGLRAGYYLCFFGMHVLTPTVMDILAHQMDAGGPVTLSSALAELARREQYLALEQTGRRYDLGARYGLLTAQMALALGGCDRDFVLAQMLELLAGQEMDRAR
jgi:UTP--glucose-1-phosphate uridylyltransferase